MKEGFLWGAATAATQIEGAFDEDGKSPTIWDGLTEGHIAHNENCKVACDHYHRYLEDVALMKKIGLNSYRFSIAWSRIIPNADGKVNQKGIDFYSNLINELLKANIQPVVTIFHWDLPMWVYNDGGYLSDNFVDRFFEYAKVVVDALSDRVKYWITFNEPQCFISGGFELCWNAPYKKSDKHEIEIMTKNVMLAHGKTAKYIRENAKTTPLIGFAPMADLVEPISDDEKEIERAYKETVTSSYGANSGGWWADPIVLGEIPENMSFLTQKDIEIIHQPLDFYAFNIYQPNNIEEVYRQGMPLNSLKWIVTENYMYYAVKFLQDRYKLPILISENGFAGDDVILSDGKVHDFERISYIQSAVKQINRAISDGYDVMGYIYWSLLDNFEWSMGYDPRFGLIYVDYATLNRTLKDSANYYKKIIKSNGKDLSFKIKIKI